MKVALITGSARGIGRKVALTLANEGYAIVVNYNSSKDRAMQLQEVLNQKNVMLE